MIEYSNVSNLAAFGAEWRGETGTLHQLVTSRGTTGLTYAARTEGGEWVSTRVDDPARFGLTEPPKNYRAFLAIVRAFVEKRNPMEFDIQQDWGYGLGWEDVTCETTPAAAVAQLNTYRENQPNIPVRIKPNGSKARAALKAYRATL